MSQYSIGFAGREDLLNQQGKQSMRTTAFGVHMGLPHYAIPLPSTHQLKALVGSFDRNLIESFHIYAVLFVLMDRQFLLLGYFGVILKQIS
jgi:hypothetical protein